MLISWARHSWWSTTENEKKNFHTHKILILDNKISTQNKFAYGTYGLLPGFLIKMSSMCLAAPSQFPLRTISSAINCKYMKIRSVQNASKHDSMNITSIFKRLISSRSYNVHAIFRTNYVFILDGNYSIQWVSTMHYTDSHTQSKNGQLVIKLRFVHTKHIPKQQSH